MRFHLCETSFFFFFMRVGMGSILLLDFADNAVLVSIE